MSEKLRRKKEGKEKNAKQQATHQGKTDSPSMEEKPGVHHEKKGPDEFDKDLKRSG